MPSLLFWRPCCRHNDAAGRPWRLPVLGFGEGLIAFGKVGIAGHGGGGLLVVLGDQVMHILVGRCTQRLKTKVIDDGSGPRARLIRRWLLCADP